MQLVWVLRRRKELLELEWWRRKEVRRRGWKWELLERQVLCRWDNIKSDR